MTVSILLRHAATSSWRAPAVSAAVVLTIAPGIGSNMVLQSFARGIADSGAASPDRETIEVIALLRIAGAVLFVLTCANVASLLLFRGNARSRDTALRVAIGAHRRQLAIQLFAESLVLATVGCALALLLGVWTAQILPALLWAPDAEQLHFDLRIGDLLVAVATAVAVLSVCGFAPLIDVKDRQAAAILQRESAGPSRRSRVARSSLVIMQTTGSCLFLIVAQLLLDRFDAAVQTALGRSVTNPVLATVGIQPSGTRAEFEARAAAYFAATELAARHATGISATAWILRPPGSAPNTQRFSVESSQLPLDEIVLDARVFTPRTLREGGLVLRRGRLFNATDTEHSCRVGLLTQDAADDLFGGQPLGRIVFDDAGAIEIVGVVTTSTGHARIDRALYYYGEQVPDAPPRETRFRIPRIDQTPTVELDTNSVVASYFDRMAVPLLAGRLFAAPAGCRVALVDRMAAEQHFKDSPLGAALIDAAGRRATITGIVESSHLRHWQRPPLPMVYFPVGQDLVPRMTLALFPTESAPVDSRKLQEALANVPGGFGEVRVSTLSEHLSRSALAPERISSLLMIWLAAITVMLAAIGLHGTLQEAARQRRQEVALRLALGARPWRLTLELSRGSLRLAGIGSALGGMLAIVLAPIVSGTALEPGRTTFVLWLSAMAMPIILTGIASVFPVYQVLRLDLTRLLRRSA